MMMWRDKRRKPNQCWDSPVWLGNQTLSNSLPRKSRLAAEPDWQHPAAARAENLEAREDPGDRLLRAILGSGGARRGQERDLDAAIAATPCVWLKTAVSLAIIAGLTSVILVMLLGQSRVSYSMSRDGLASRIFSDIHPKFRTPWRSNLVFMVFVSLFSAFAPISRVGHMTSIGTLFAFVVPGDRGSRGSRRAPVGRGSAIHTRRPR
jgi:hypothetical protein